MTTTTLPSPYTFTDALLAPLALIAVVAAILLIFAALTHFDD